MKKIYMTALCITLTSCSLFVKNDSKENHNVRSTAAAEALDGSGYSFDPKDTSCDGYPRLKVETMPGTCLGIVFHHGNSSSGGKVMYKMPRTILKIPNTNDFLVADMGGWAPKAGGLFWLRNDGGKKYSLVKVWEKLDYAHGLAYSEADKFFYLGENSRITRFHFLNGQVKDKEIVIDNLPDVAKHMHPLTQFVFNPANNDLYINSGAPTDHCFQADGNYKQRCPEEVLEKMASIQKISHEKLKVLPKGGLKNGDVELVAQGLRNSMAMAIHPTGRFLIQGENSRDFPELEEPYEEMNVVRLDQPDVVKHYGWPYCYNNHGTSPEWQDIFIKDKIEYKVTNESKTKALHGANPFYCGRTAIQGLKDYQRPFSLIPPHAAPLFADYYEGEMFPELRDQLLMSWHGHRTTGQRFVSYKTNAQGLPVLKKAGNEFYKYNLPDGCTKTASFNPRGGFRKHIAPYTEVISSWGPIKGVRPKGAPTGFTVANDGSIWIVEDKNKTIVRLAKSSEAHFAHKCNTTPGQNKDLNVPLLVWRNAMLAPESKQLRADYNTIKTTLRQDKYCLKCHEEFINKDLNEDFGKNPDEFATMDFFVRSDWFKPGKPDESLIYGAVTGSPLAPPMPPSGYSSLKDSPEGLALIATLKKWIEGLPKDIEKRSEQVVIGKNLNIRPKPTTDTKACGQFQKGDIAYVDPRAASKILANNITWSKVYLVPGHSRLSPGACVHPVDGVFYIAK